MENKNRDQEILEAIFAAETVLLHLKDAETSLNKAKNWGIFDILGGGIITTVIKHNRMDEANRHISLAKDAMYDLSRELQDIDDYVDVDIQIDSFISMADYFFDGFIADWLVQSKINKARQQVTDAIRETEKIILILKEAQ